MSEHTLSSEVSPTTGPPGVAVMAASASGPTRNVPLMGPLHWVSLPPSGSMRVRSRARAVMTVDSFTVNGTGVPVE